MLSNNFTQFGRFDGLAPLNEAVKLKTDSIKSQQNYIKLKTITKKKTEKRLKIFQN